MLKQAVDDVFQRAGSCERLRGGRRQTITLYTARRHGVDVGDLDRAVQLRLMGKEAVQKQRNQRFHARGGERKMEKRTTVLESMISVSECLDRLQEMVQQHCTPNLDDRLDSMAISTNADAMLLLAKVGRLRLTNLQISTHASRRVLGTWIKEKE